MPSLTSEVLLPPSRDQNDNAGYETNSRRTTVSLVHCDGHSLGGNAVGHDLERTGASFHPRGNIKIGGNGGVARGHSHGAVVVRPGVENVTGGSIRDPHQGVVRRRLQLVPKRGRL